MKNSIDIDKNSSFLGYYYGVGEVLSLSLLPQPGMFFINGETNSVWVWDALSKMWVDTNRTDSGLKGLLTNKIGNSPSDFVPTPQQGVKESYFYVAECEDVDFNPEASSKTVVFKNFKNGVNSLSVTIRKTSIIILYWNGSYWEISAVPMNIDWSHFVSKTDLADVYATIGNNIYEDVIKAGTSKAIFSLTPFIGKAIKVKVLGNFSSFGYYDPQIGIGYKTLGQSDDADKIISFVVPETASSFFVYNSSEMGDTSVSVICKANISEAVESIQESVESLNADIEKLNSTIGYIELKGIEIATVKHIISLIPYIGKSVMVKVSGYFQNFGYYYTDGEDLKYKSLTNYNNYDGGYYSFVVPENVTNFYVYTDAPTKVDVELRANLSANLLQNEVTTKGCVFMSLGDSITTESYYVPKLRDILQSSKYYNLAVAGAWWADKDGTVYDGNPQFNGADGNKNNVLGNQVQKIIDNPELYSEAPDIIIIAAGTNDSGNMRVANNATMQEIREAIENNYKNENGEIIPLSEPTFDENDRYQSYRKTIGGAMRYCVNKLQELFPRAKIYILTPIQGCYASRDYASSIATKQEYITESAKHLGVPVIHVGEECGINADFEYQGAMWSAPSGSHERSGRDLIDGLHPNANGSKKMADYIALNIINSYKSSGKIYSVIGSLLSVAGRVDGNTLKL